jgi:signal transduction histidine kinase/tetratricopeptide (TPR) repeat protein
MCCIWLLPLGMRAASAREDSLLRVLATMPQDTHRVLTYNELFKATFTSEPLRALDYAQKALQLAKDLHYRSGIARLSNNLGVWHSKRGNYKQSLGYYAQAKATLAELDDFTGSADCEMNIGSVHYKMGNYDLALLQYESALQSYRDLRDTTRMLSAVNNMGSVLKERGHYPEALQAYMAALLLRERLGDPVELGLSCANVGTIYQLEGMPETAKKFFMRSLSLAHQANDQFGKVAALTSIAEIYMEQDRPDMAQPLLESARSIAREIDDQNGLAAALLSLAMLHQHRAMPDSAQRCYEEALVIFRDIGRMQGIATALNHIGELRLGQGAHALAEASLLESLALSDSLQTLDLSRDNHLLLSKLYSQQGDYAAAYMHQGAFLQLHDSLFSNEKAKQIAEMRARYEATQQLDEINRLNLQATQDQLRIAKSSWRNLILLAILLPMILLALIFFLRYIQKRRHNRRIEEKNAQIQHQRDLLEAQNHQIREINIRLEKMVEERTQSMRNAHKELDTFLYESAHALRRPLLRIQGLEDLLATEEDPLLKERLRGQLRVTLAGMDELLHKLIYVSESGRRDLQQEQICLKDLIAEVTAKQPIAEALTCDFPPEFSFAADSYLLKVLLAVVIENAFRFLDLGSRRQAVAIGASQDASTVTIEVRDNGSGIDAETLPKVTEMFFRGSNHRGGNGLGLYIASKIVDKMHGTLAIDSTPGVGTTVRITLPKREA